MISLDRQERALDRWTSKIVTIGFTGLAVVALLTMFDSMMRWLSLPRISGFSDIGEVIFAVVIATCFPAGLVKGNNVSIRFLGSALGPRVNQWLESFGALATLVFFGLLGWQFIVLTWDLQINSRVTQTLEYPVAPWWWITTAIILLCIPVQVWVVFDRVSGAITGNIRLPLEPQDGSVEADGKQT
jgi:TRAP-type C4-dicarboxylate transport system permease small subunit